MATSTVAKFGNFIHQLAKPTLEYIETRSLQEQAFANLALIVYAQKAESAMYGALLPETVNTTRRMLIFGGYAAAPRWGHADHRRELR